MTVPRIQTDSLSVHFGDRSALESVNVAFDAGQTTSILGPNGAGKSTLLKTISGMLPATHGSVLLDGEAVTCPCSRVVYVPQRSAVDWSFPISVLDVTLMGIGLRRSRFRPLSSEDKAAAHAALVAVNMNTLANIQIGQLSGGQQQRVFLARALLQHGDVYLLDEPFTGVDVPTQGLLVELFANLAHQGKTIIYATHDLALAAATSDRVLLLNRKVIADGPPASTMTADNLRATFGGQAVVPPPEIAA
ncbi:MAG: metal ABC transporter ATP-binding protein [Thermomicrobiales bacterium]